MTERLDPEVAILNAALELQSEDRAVYIEKSCAGDDVLRAKVEGLLQANDQAGGFLESPAKGLDFKRTLPLPTFPAEKAGDRIGRYKLLQQIGEGGCGVVYMAEQEEPVRRRVAIKVIKLGMDTKQVVARFEAERQALALMDHPNIAKVFDAGATEMGRPYFVMELVRGIKITDYCDENNLTTTQRLDLFLQICQAIQHAHQKGIIHRDIKPSNILIANHDGVPVPKIIDFGIAKATTDQRLTDKTLFTAFEQFIGTPAYMSPEQAKLSGLDVDTRSDIYALGVLLYELLTGHTPFDSAKLLAGTLEEIRRTIREVEPAKPSTRLSTMLASDLTEVAKHRRAEASKLPGLIRGDLDWIVMKCLEKDRMRRYETANALADDIQHHLHHEPVMARPPSRLYRFQKLVRRNKVPFAAAGAVAASLIVGLGLSTWLFFREREARRDQARLRQQAEFNEKKAQTEAANSKQVVRSLRDMLGSIEDLPRGRDTLVREMLDRAAARFNRDFTNQPEVELQLQITIASAYMAIGEPVKAEAIARTALALGRQFPPNQQDTEVADSLSILAYALWSQGKSREAEPLARESLAIQEKLGARDSLVASAGAEAREARGFITTTIEMLGLIVQNEGQLLEAENLFRESLAIRRKLLGNQNPAVAHSMNTLASGLLAQGKLDEAEKLAREALAIYKATPDSPYGITPLLYTVGNALYEQGRLAEAENFFRESVALRRERLGNEHDVTAVAVSSLASTLRRQGKFAEAEPLYRECLATREKKVPDAWFTFYTRTLLAQTLVEQKKYAEAEPLLLSGYEGMKQREANIRDRQKVFSETLQYLVRLYEETSRPDQAAAWKQKLAELEKAEIKAEVPVPHP